MHQAVLSLSKHHTGCSYKPTRHRFTVQRVQPTGLRTRMNKKHNVKLNARENAAIKRPVKHEAAASVA